MRGDFTQSWAKQQFDEAVRALLGDDAYPRNVTAPGHEDRISLQYDAVAVAAFLGEIKSGTAEQMEIVRETMRRMHRVDGVRGLTK